MRSSKEGSYLTKIKGPKLSIFTNMKASFIIFPDSGCFFFHEEIKLKSQTVSLHLFMVIFGFADHVRRVIFTVCVDDHQPPPKTFFDPGKTLSVRITT